jgi:guanylate kinase
VRARLVVVSGPSGVGKGTLINGALGRLSDLALATSATTRPMRPGEADGREYHFLTPEEFEVRVAGGEFLEHVDYAGHRYGTLRSEVERRLEAGESVMLEVEVEGARAIKRLRPDAVLVFVAPPTLEALGERLRSRGANSEAEIAARLGIAGRELEASEEFDHVIVNDDAGRATDELVAAVAGARRGEAPG